MRAFTLPRRRAIPKNIRRMEIAQTALVDVYYTALGVEETTHVARTLHVYNSFTIQQQSILPRLLQLHRQNYPYF